MTVFRVLVIAILFCCSSLAQAIGVMSWNIERLGHGTNKDYHALAVSIAGNGADLVAVQEAMNEGGLRRLLAELRSVTGEPWDMRFSHRIGRGSYKEKYAFLWNARTVEFVGRETVYLDVTDRFAREPYSAIFRDRASGATVLLATVHILYGRSVSDRTPEIEALAHYWDWLVETFPEVRGEVLLVGDFNLPPEHAAWSALQRHARPLVTEGATTVSTIEGRFANLYDNIWAPRTTRLPLRAARVINGPGQLGISHTEYRRTVSDHVPVMVNIGSEPRSLSPATAGARPTPPQSRPDTAAGAAPILGNPSSRIFHRPDCPSYGRLNRERAEMFSSAAEARAAGYRQAQNCP